jgi:hypothetical protein
MPSPATPSSCFVVLLGGLLQLSAPWALAAEYHVSVSGNDASGTGTPSASWRTVQKAANAARPGDTVFLHAGIYRETVVPAHSGTAGQQIVYRSYPGEKATLSGLDPLGEWTAEGAGLHWAEMPWDLGDGNQIFTAGEMLPEAHWPNNTGTLLQPLRAVAGAGTATSITDDALSGAADAHVGAAIHLLSGKAWIIQTAPVTAYDDATRTLRFAGLHRVGDAYTPQAGNRYHLSGLKAYLDSPGEWWYDRDQARLYLHGAVPAAGLEAKRRRVAFALDDRQHIQIIDVDVVGATITMNQGTEDCLIQGGRFSHVSHRAFNTAAGEQEGLGLLLHGHRNEINRCEITHSSGSLVTVAGEENRLVNCHVHHGGYVPDWPGLVNLRGVRSLVSHNTISEAGRVCLFLKSARENLIQYNKVFHSGRLATDLGNFYAVNTDAQNTEIRFNHFHDNVATHTGSEFYPDNYTSNFIVHHNVMWGSEGIRLNTPSNYILIYNNTALDVRTPVRAWGRYFGGDMSFNRIYNNIVAGLGTIHANPAANTDHGHNLTADPGFVDPAARDYRLRPTAVAAIDQGVVEPGITDGYSGRAPDIGAYELSAPDWKPGHDFNQPPSPPVWTPPQARHRNRVINGGFESGALAPWTRIDAQQAAVVYDDRWRKTEAEGLSRAQFYGVQLGGTPALDSIGQTVTGLEPDMDYRLGAWLRSPAGEKIEITVQDFGGEPVSRTYASAVWMLHKLTFRTGADATRATIQVRKISAGSDFVYADDIGLQILTDELPAAPFADGFESGFAGWTVLNGQPSTSDTVARTGRFSYIVDEEKDALKRRLRPGAAKVVTVWFYDALADVAHAQIRADDGSNIRGIGLETGISASHYVFWADSTKSMSPTVSSVARSRGWHEARLDYSSDERCELYLDGTLIAALPGLTDFSEVRIGALTTFRERQPATQAPARGPVYFDDVEIR